MHIHHTLDLKGEVCPYTVIKSKHALKRMAAGEVLKIVINNPPAVENIPRTMEEEGHKILKVERINTSDWQIIVEKEGTEKVP